MTTTEQPSTTPKNPTTEEAKVLSISQVELEAMLKEERSEARTSTTEELTKAHAMALEQERESWQKKVRSLEEQLHQSEHDRTSESVHHYLALHGYGKLMDLIELRSLEEAQKLVAWLEENEELASEGTHKPIANNSPTQLSASERRKANSDRFLMNLFPWLN